MNRPELEVTLEVSSQTMCTSLLRLLRTSWGDTTALCELPSSPAVIRNRKTKKRKKLIIAKGVRTVVRTPFAALS